MVQITICALACRLQEASLSMEPGAWPARAFHGSGLLVVISAMPVLFACVRFAHQNKLSYQAGNEKNHNQHIDGQSQIAVWS